MCVYEYGEINIFTVGESGFLPNRYLTTITAHSFHETLIEDGYIIEVTCVIEEKGIRNSKEYILRTSNQYCNLSGRDNFDINNLLLKEVVDLKDGKYKFTFIADKKTRNLSTLSRIESSISTLEDNVGSLNNLVDEGEIISNQLEEIIDRASNAISELEDTISESHDVITEINESGDSSKQSSSVNDSNYLEYNGSVHKKVPVIEFKATKSNDFRVTDERILIEVIEDMNYDIPVEHWTEVDGDRHTIYCRTDSIFSYFDDHRDLLKKFQSIIPDNEIVILKIIQAYQPIEELANIYTDFDIENKIIYITKDLIEDYSMEKAIENKLNYIRRKESKKMKLVKKEHM